MNTSTKFIIVPMGSAGDVHPMLWLARLLHARGHEVVVIAQAAVVVLVERCGVPFIAVGNAEDMDKVLRHPDLWHPRKAFDLLAQYMPIYAREMLPVIQKELDPGRTVLVAGSIAFAARIVAERFDVPMISVHLQPSLMMSVENSPVMMAGAEWLPRAPRWLRRLFFTFVNWKVDRTFSKSLGEIRRDIGIPGPYPKGVMRDWWHSPDGVICLFPEWFASKARDWPAQSTTTRFPLYDEAEVMEKDAEAERFLAAGEPPIIVTPGSANSQAARFLREAALACRKMNRRAMLLTRYPEQVPAGMPDSIKSFEYIPFGRVFPRSAAVVHHGGVGTTAQCFAAGVPQLIMPMAHDQPDNAARIKRFGVGDYLYPRAFKAARIAAKLEALMRSPDVKKACTDYQHKVRQQMSPADMSDLLESLARRAVDARRQDALAIPA